MRAGIPVSTIENMSRSEMRTSVQLVTQHGVPAQLRRAQVVGCVASIIAHAHSTELLEEVIQEEYVRLELKLPVLLPCYEIERAPHIGCQGIVSLTTSHVVEVREEGVSTGRTGVFIFSHAARCSVWVCCPLDRDGGPKLREEVLPRPERHEMVCCPALSQRVVCVREAGACTEELLAIQRVLANNVLKAPPAEALLDLPTGDVR